MSKWVVDIHGDIEGDYELIKKYDESKTDLLNKIRAEIEQTFIDDAAMQEYTVEECLRIIDRYKAESEE